MKREDKEYFGAIVSIIIITAVSLAMIVHFIFNI